MLTLCRVSRRYSFLFGRKASKGLLLQLPRIATDAAIAAASITASGGALVVVGHGVLVGFLLCSPRQLCATDGSGRSALPLATNGTQECRRQPCSSLSASCPGGSGCQRWCPTYHLRQGTTCQAHPSPLGSAACRSALPLSQSIATERTEGTQERCLESPAHRGTAIMQGE